MKEYNLWSSKIDFDIIYAHILFLGVYDYTSFNTVIWSLVHELRISFIFPVLVLLLYRRNWGCSIFLLLVTGIIVPLIYRYYPMYYSNYWDTIHYTGMFIMGFLLAVNREQLKNFYIFLAPGYRVILGLASFLLYTYPFYNKWSLMQRFFGDYLVMLGAAGFIIIAISSNHVQKILNIGAICFLGKISYSLYLCHMIVFIVLTRAFLKSQKGVTMI